MATRTTTVLIQALRHRQLFVILSALSTLFHLVVGWALVICGRIGTSCLAAGLITLPLGIAYWRLVAVRHLSEVLNSKTSHGDYWLHVLRVYCVPVGLIFVLATTGAGIPTGLRSAVLMAAVFTLAAPLCETWLVVATVLSRDKRPGKDESGS